MLSGGRLPRPSSVLLRSRAVASYEHAYDLVRAHGEAGWTARLVPLTVDGLIYASSMIMLDSARRAVRVPALARWLLGLGIATTLAANVAHGLGPGPVGAALAAWPAIAWPPTKLLMMVIRSSQVPAGGAPETGHDADPLREPALGCSLNSSRRTRFPRYARSVLASTWAAPDTRTVRFPRYRRCKAGEKSRRVSNLRGRALSQRPGLSRR